MQADHLVGLSKDVVVETRGCVGLITLNRPKALNALSLSMIRQIATALEDWKSNPAIQLVAIRGMGKNPAHDADPSAPALIPFGSFCAGGDIRFFYHAALAGDPALEDFFTEEYALNHLIHTYPKPYIAFMDGIVMGGGMGLSQGASHRIVTERTKMAMPETGIGLFPDVGGGYFLSRCPGRVGEYLALTGHMIGGDEAVSVGLADCHVSSADLPMLWNALGELKGTDSIQVRLSLDTLITTKLIANYLISTSENSLKSLSILSNIDAAFAASSMTDILTALQRDGSAWAFETAHILRSRSPLMLHVVLKLIRRARSLSLADDLRLERDLIRHCIYTAHLGRSGARSETVEGIRALVVDKDHAPRWSPARIEDVTPDMVEPFFKSPWPNHSHPLKMLGH